MTVITQKRLALTTAVALMLMAGTAFAQSNPTNQSQTGTMNNASSGYQTATQGANLNTATSGSQGTSVGSQSSSSVPGAPNTGAGGDTGVNLFVLGVAAVIALFGALYVARRRGEQV